MTSPTNIPWAIPHTSIPTTEYELLKEKSWKYDQLSK